MAKKSFWKRLRERRMEQDKVDIVKDLDAVIEFLQEVQSDVNLLLPELKKLEDLEKERKVATSGILHVNLETQADVLEKLLERYQFFQDDVDVSGLRIKAIANQFLKNAKKAGLSDLVKEKKNNKHWKFFW